MEKKGIAATIFVIAVSILFLTHVNTTAFQNGVGDSDQEFDCGSCHGTLGTGSVIMSSSTSNPYTEDPVTVTVEVTESQLGTNSIVGVVLSKSLTGTPSNPSEDGWLIVSDPNGNPEPYNFNEIVSPGAGSTVTFEWELRAPASSGNYHLYARVYHGGSGTAYYEDCSIGLTFTVEAATFPQFVYLQPPVSAASNVPIPVNATIKDDVGVTAAKLYFLGTDASKYSSIDMSRISGDAKKGNWKGEIPAQTELGSLRLYVEASDGTSTSKSDEYLMEITESLDLVPLDIVLSETEPAVNEELVITAKIKNDGQKDLEDVRIMFLDYYYVVSHAKYIGIVSNVSIQKNETVEVNVWWLPQAEGEHRIGVLVDPDDTIDESDEFNNVLTMNVSVTLSKHEGLQLPSLQDIAGAWPFIVAGAAAAVVAVVLLYRRKLARSVKRGEP
jgi:hypothetical protein